ncbi:adenylyltransferase/cytidyltransferase family protein [Paraglaciecola sp. L3A3]|uniref:adenylyltransferase/cytidyltransferase family protein n=1 Tax=Paraglaciecola sp. L3A3 TaxID=2686358 RepID=UPI00131E2C3E|nr:adenylyltransferase/cytidyltransferase family protein [Paraglaciecola sp. L3A3]
MAKGLTLGKFAPLHKGHQALIDFSLRYADQLVIVIYACDELPSCPLPIRIKWLEQLYPQVQVILAIDGPKEVGYSQEIINKHDVYLQELLKDHCFDYFFSSESYGEHVSLALNCKDIRFDQARTKVPISATKIRNNVDQFKDYLSPLVYNTLIEQND